jgi:hypothetical protein
MGGGVSWRPHCPVGLAPQPGVSHAPNPFCFAHSPSRACPGSWLAGADLALAAPSVAIAIVDFAYVDTSGEPTDQTAAHQRRLQTFMAALRRDFAADGQFRLVAVSCGSVPCSTDGLAPADLRRVGSQAGAKILVIGGIHKLSTLVQWAKVEAVDIDADRVVFDRLFTFAATATRRGLGPRPSCLGTSARLAAP